MIKSLLVELIGKGSYQNIIPICCYTDNKSLVDTINLTKTLTEKRLQVDICTIRKMIKKQEVKQITWCDTAQKIKFSFKDFFSKCNQIRRNLQIWSHLLKKSLKENIPFLCSMIADLNWLTVLVLLDCFTIVVFNLKECSVSAKKRETG